MIARKIVMSRILCYNFIVKKKVHKILEYSAVFEPDSVSGGFVVTIPALPGCISEGNTFEDAKKNIEEAASLYLEFLEEKKEEVPIESGKSFVAPVRVFA